MAPQIIQKSASEPRARPGLAQGPPRGLQRAFREAFWAHFGFNSVPPGAHVRAFRGARLLLLACCLSIAGALFLLRPLLRCSPSELPGYEAQVTKAIASWFS